MYLNYKKSLKQYNNYLKNNISKLWTRNKKRYFFKFEIYDPNDFFLSFYIKLSQLNHIRKSFKLIQKIQLLG